MSKVTPLKRFVWSLTDLDFGDQESDDQFCEHGSLTAACHASSCRPPTSGGTGGSSPGFNPPNGADMSKRLSERLAMRRTAAGSGGSISVGPSIEGMTKSWNEALPDEPRVRIRVPASALDSIASQGVLTQREVGTSGGRFAPHMRDQVEEWMFGKPGTDPRYGYILTRRGLETGSAWSYGDVALELKPSVHDRVTVTAHDSLRVVEEFVMAPIPMNEIRTASDERTWAASDGPVRPNDFTHFEAQIHGTVTASDIARVITNNPEAAKRARVLFPDAEIVLKDTDEFSTVTVGFVAGAFEMACDTHGEFACKSAACRPPTSGGTGGSLPGLNRPTGTPGPRSPGKGGVLEDLLTKEVSDLNDQTDRTVAKVRSVNEVSRRMTEDPEFKEWAKEMFGTSYHQPGDADALRTYIANKILREAGMHKDPSATLLDAIKSINEDGSTPEEFLAKRVTNQLIHEWTSTSSDHSLFALAAQMAAAKVHDVDDGPLRNRPDMVPELIADAEKVANHDQKMLAAFTRSEYAATQAYLKEKGVTSVIVYRGMMVDSDSPAGKAREKDVVDVEGQPLSSWSASSGIALQFARGSTWDGSDKPRRIVLSMEVPVEAIQSIPFSGRGCLPEQEAVIIGFPSTATVVDSFK